jgi:hypothetical protein
VASLIENDVYMSPVVNLPRGTVNHAYKAAGTLLIGKKGQSFKQEEAGGFGMMSDDTCTYICTQKWL